MQTLSVNYFTLFATQLKTCSSLHTVKPKNANGRMAETCQLKYSKWIINQEETSTKRVKDFVVFVLVNCQTVEKSNFLAFLLIVGGFI